MRVRIREGDDQKGVFVQQHLKNLFMRSLLSACQPDLVASRKLLEEQGEDSHNQSDGNHEGREPGDTTSMLCK